MPTARVWLSNTSRRLSCLLLGKTIRLLPNADGELRAAEAYAPAAPAAVERYIVKAFGDHLAEVRAAMQVLAAKYDPIELNRVGFRLYERFRPDVAPGNEGWGAKAGSGQNSGCYAATFLTRSRRIAARFSAENSFSIVPAGRSLPPIRQQAPLSF
jgi:hypothetical protein